MTLPKYYLRFPGTLVHQYTVTEIKHMLLETKSQAEWEEIVEALKKDNGGRYPDWWKTVIMDNDVHLRAGWSWSSSDK